MAKSESVRLSADALHDFLRRIFVSAGLRDADAETVAEVLTWANLRGVDSHGALRVPVYLGFLEKGEMNAAAKPRVLIDLPATVMIDADRAPGPSIMIEATDRAIVKAKSAGIGMVLMKHVTHTGPIGYYALRAAEAGMAAIVMSASTPNMAYYGTKRAGVANCPLAIGVPCAGRPPIVLDMATSVAASGKLRQAEDTGAPIPEGWALTKDGEPCTDPRQATVLLPLGGAKGSGLALMIECLTGMMAANPILEAILTGRKPKGHRQNAMVIAIDIAAFSSVDDYGQSASALADALKSLPKAPDATEILMPGERGAATEAERRRDGIPLAPGTWKKLQDVAKERGLALPETL